MPTKKNVLLVYL